MRFVFFGNPGFSAIILEKLIETGLKPELIVCNPDKPVGRKKIITPPVVKVVAEQYGTPVWQPDNIKNLKFEIQNLKFDVFIVAAYGKIIPKEILGIPKYGVVNVHPSLLPKYRGPTPIQTAILNGEEETGVSLILMDEEMDHGPILKNQKSKIKNQNYEALMRELAYMGATLLIEILPKFLRGEIRPVQQDHTKATFTKKFTSEDAYVPYDDLQAALEGDGQKALQIDRMIRALNPEPGVWTKTAKQQIYVLPKNKRVKLLAGEIKRGKLVLKNIQVEGKNPISI